MKNNAISLFCTALFAGAFASTAILLNTLTTCHPTVYAKIKDRDRQLCIYFENVGITPMFVQSRQWKLNHQNIKSVSSALQNSHSQFDLQDRSLSPWDSDYPIGSYPIGSNMKTCLFSATLNKTKTISVF